MYPWAVPGSVSGVVTISATVFETSVVVVVVHDGGSLRLSVGCPCSGLLYMDCCQNLGCLLCVLK